MGVFLRSLGLAPLLVVVGLGCVAQPAATPAPAPAPRVATAPVGDTTLGTLSLIDDRMRRAWPDNPDGPAWFVGAGYQLHARTPGDFVALRAPTVGPVDDVVITGMFRKVGGPPGGGYGLIVRDRRAGLGDGIDQNGQFVVAAVGDRGEVGVWRRDGDKWLDLMPWTATPAVHAGGSSNELRVEVLAERLRFDVNGTTVADVPVTLQNGRVGLFVGGDGNEVLIDRLTVQPLPSARQTDLRAKEADVREAQSTIARLSAAAHKSTPPTPGEAEQWRSEVAGVASLVKQLGGDFTEEYASSQGRDPRSLAKLKDQLVDLERDVVAILDVYREGFDSPHSPVNDRGVLASTAARLDSASRKAEVILDEVQQMRSASESNRR
jgi:hypothetical protein